jgi:exodeoxyribonuclease III
MSRVFRNSRRLRRNSRSGAARRRLWVDLEWPEELERCCYPGAGEKPKETRRGLPGEPTDIHSRYIEAEVDGVLIGCLYLPNGNPAPGPKFDYKLRWFERLTSYAAPLLKLDAPVVLAGDYNVMPTELDVYKPERWLDDVLFRSEVRRAFHTLSQQGWTDALRALHPGEQIFTFWDYFRNAYETPVFASITCLPVQPSQSA